MDEIPNGTDVILQGFGEGQGFSNSPRHSLPQSIVESLNVAGFPVSVMNFSPEGAKF
jgi:hypothetical protein